MKVLFCTDGSEISYWAIKKALPFLHKEDRISILNVIDWGLLPTYVTFPAPTEEAYPDEKNSAKELVEKVANLIVSEGYAVENVDYSYGRPAEVILNSINDDGYDLAVLGSHGKRGIKKWLGSVSRKVVTHSGSCVLIAKPPEESRKVFFKGIKKILFAADGSEYSYNAVRKALMLLNLDNSTIEILTVKPGRETLPIEITSDPEWLEACLKKQDEEAFEIMQKTSMIIKDSFLEVESANALQGDPAEVILNYAKSEEIELVVMGSHGRSGFADFLLGSVSKRVLDHTSCSTLIVPAGKIIK